MKTTSFPLLCAVLAATVSLSACSKPATHQVSAEQARSLLVDRNWLSKMPENKRDHFQVFRFIPEFNHSGVYQDRTLFIGFFELFAFEHSGDEIRFNMLQNGEKKTVPYRVEELGRGEAPEPFDLRLTLDASPRGPSVYYGMKAEGHDTDLDQSLIHLLNRQPNQ